MKIVQVISLVAYYFCVADASPLKENSLDDRCGTQKDFFDSKGNYLKTACIIFKAQSHQNACKSANMNLFVIDSNDIKFEVLKFATSIFGSGGGSTLWINGKRENGGGWYTETSEKKPMNNNFLKPFEDQEAKCLILSAFWEFRVDTRSCKMQMYPICEYEKSRISSTTETAFLPMTDYNEENTLGLNEFIEKSFISKIDDSIIVKPELLIEL
jgi:hypothetical protein